MVTAWALAPPFDVISIDCNSLIFKSCATLLQHNFPAICAQESSHSESLSTLAFGGRVSEIALGAAKKNVESGAIFEAREAAKGMDAAASRERQARKGAESRAAAAEAALEAARRDVNSLQVRSMARLMPA